MWVWLVTEGRSTRRSSTLSLRNRARTGKRTRWIRVISTYFRITVLRISIFSSSAAISARSETIARTRARSAPVASLRAPGAMASTPRVSSAAVRACRAGESCCAHAAWLRAFSLLEQTKEKVSQQKKEEHTK